MPRSRIAGLVGLGAAGVLLSASPASAHARLVRTNPVSGSSVSAAPAVLDLTFDEAVATDPVTVAVTGPDGSDVTAGPATVHGAVVEVALKAAKAAGVYHVAYRVISDDGHPVSDRWEFTLTGAAADGKAAPQAAAAVPAGPVGDDPATTWWVAHAIHLLLGAAVIGVGGWLMVLLTRPPKPRDAKA